jgi:hypothetical protein
LGGHLVGDGLYRRRCLGLVQHKSLPKIEDIEAEITARMKSGKPFTALDLYGGRPTAAYRLADKLIQRWRKKG